MSKCETILSFVNKFEKGIEKDFEGLMKIDPIVYNSVRAGIGLDEIHSLKFAILNLVKVKNEYEKNAIKKMVNSDVVGEVLAKVNSSEENFDE